MKGKESRGYPYRGTIHLQLDVILLRVDFDEGGKPEYPEKNPRESD